MKDQEFSLRESLEHAFQSWWVIVEHFHDSGSWLSISIQAEYYFWKAVCPLWCLRMQVRLRKESE
jgi:hypothetical protein